MSEVYLLIDNNLMTVEEKTVNFNYDASFTTNEMRTLDVSNISIRLPLNGIYKSLIVLKLRMSIEDLKKASNSSLFQKLQLRQLEKSPYASRFTHAYEYVIFQYALGKNHIVYSPAFDLTNYDNIIEKVEIISKIDDLLLEEIPEEIKKGTYALEGKKLVKDLIDQYLYNLLYDKLVEIYGKTVIDHIPFKKHNYLSFLQLIQKYELQGWKCQNFCPIPEKYFSVEKILPEHLEEMARENPISKEMEPDILNLPKQMNSTLEEIQKVETDDEKINVGLKLINLFVAPETPITLDNAKDNFFKTIMSGIEKIMSYTTNFNEIMKDAIRNDEVEFILLNIYLNRTLLKEYPTYINFGMKHWIAYARKQGKEEIGEILTKWYPFNLS